MAKPNYSFEKRQREIAKQKKKAEKLARKQGPKGAEDGSDADTADQGISSTPAPTASGS